MSRVPTDDTPRLAVLIDADNTAPGLAADVLAEIAKYGTPTIKRAYGDWTTNQLGGWKDALLELAIQPMQQFANTRGKNSTDSALIIDAMDLLYAGNVEGFAIVTSDGDFTALARRLRQSGMTVYGLGSRNTPTALVAACDRFIYLDLLSQEHGKPELMELLSAAISSTSRDDGWSHLSDVGTYLYRRDAAFDPRDYGHSTLGKLVRAQGDIDVSDRAGALWVRLSNG
jgi:hypothetical protein